MLSLEVVWAGHTHAHKFFHSFSKFSWIFTAEIMVQED